MPPLRSTRRHRGRRPAQPHSARRHGGTARTTRPPTSSSYGGTSNSGESGSSHEQVVPRIQLLVGELTLTIHVRLITYDLLTALLLVAVPLAESRRELGLPSLTNAPRKTSVSFFAFDVTFGQGCRQRNGVPAESVAAICLISLLQVADILRRVGWRVEINQLKDRIAERVKVERSVAVLFRHSSVSLSQSHTAFSHAKNRSMLSPTCSIGWPSSIAVTK